MTAPVSRQTLEVGLWCPMPIESIEPSALNPRKHFDQVALDELGASLEADGLLQPIIVRKVRDTGGGIRGGNRYQIVAGERRWRAARQLGWSEIPAIIRNDVDDATHVRLALLENLARTDLDPLEEAGGYQQLLDLGMTQEQIAEAVHRSRPAIANALRLLKAPEPVQQKLRDGALQPSHVLPLLRYEAFPDVVIKLAEVAAEKRTPSKELEKAELDWEFTTALREAKLAVEVTSAVFVWQRVCKKCPFGAFAPGRYGGQCFKPEHFRQLQKEVRDTRKAETKAALEAAATPGGPAVLQLRSLKYGQYERLDWAGAKPKACTTKCECRRAALDGTRTVQVCVKPARFRQLKEEERRTEEAERKQRQEQLAEACGQVLDRVDGVGRRELALLAAEALEPFARDGKRLLAVLSEHAPQLKSKDLTLDNLARLEPLQLVKLAVEAVLAEDLRELEYGRKADYATWYAGPAPKTSKPSKASRKGKPPRVTDEQAAQIHAPHTNGVDEAIAAESAALEQEYIAEVIGQELAEVRS